LYNRSKFATFLASFIFLCVFFVTAGFSSPVDQAPQETGEPKELSLPLNDAGGHWAESAIAEMYAKDVMKGYKDSSFRPNKPVTFLEAVVLLDRLLGYEPSDADIESGAYLSDVFKIPQWAAGYVSVALKQQIVEYSQIQKISLRQPLTRQDGAVLAVRALNWTKLARQKKAAVLPFNDVQEIDLNTKGCIAIVNERRIMNGYPDHNFQPSAPVSRAEMAVLLSNIGQQLPYVNSDETAGFISSMDTVKKEITIVSGDQKEVVFTLPDRYLLYLNNKPSNLDSLAKGNHIRIIDSTSVGLVILIARTVLPDTGTAVTSEQVNPAAENVTIQQWIETNKSAEIYLANVLSENLYFLATRGEKMTSGYTVNITKVSSFTDDKGTHYRVWIDRSDPSPGAVVYPAISYPYALVKIPLPEGVLGTVTFVDQLNQVIAEAEL